jgi:autotransporter-associated beta strand protein
MLPPVANWLRTWSRQSSRTNVRKAPARRLLNVERLEARETPATWTPLTHSFPGGSGAGTMMLLTDGTVMIQNGGTNNWYKLSPDSAGNYVNGTYSSLASMSTQRLYYASNVLPSGKVFVLGGEYSGPSLANNWTNTGEMYDPVANSWSSITNFPNASFGDDPSQLLANGNVLVGYLSGGSTYIYNVTNNSWSPTGSKVNNDRSDEETWVKLSDGSILSYDVFTGPSAERYIPSTGTWQATGPVPVNLTNSSSELGPGLQMPDGRVLFVGANGNTAIYDPSTNGWVAGPTVPKNGNKTQGADDAPGAALVNGHILFAVDTSSPAFNGPTQLFDFDPSTNSLTQQTSANTTGYGSLSGSLNGAAYVMRMLALPNGHVLFTTSGSTLWDYAPDGAPQDAWRPTISNIAFNGGTTYTLTGTQLNGLTEGASYGDDAEMSSNYPLVRLTSSGGTVYYARTTNWSSTAVATGSTPVTTQFTLPANLPIATYSLSVVANGIASAPVNFSPPVYADTRWANLTQGATITDADPVAAGNQPAVFGANAFASVNAAIAAEPAGGMVIVNGADGSGFGIFNESVALNKAATLLLQYGPVTFGSLSGTATGGAVSLNGVPLTTGGDGTNTEFDGVIAGASGVTKTGAGTFTLTGTNTFSGAFNINQGVIAVGANGPLGNGTLTFRGGTLQATAGFTASRQISLVTAGGTFDSNGFNFTVTGKITGTGPLTKIGSGTLTLGGSTSNTYVGLTTVAAGVLDIGKSAAVSGFGGDAIVTGGTLQLLASSEIPSTSTITVTSGTFDLNGYSATIAALAGSGGQVNLGASGGSGASALTIAGAGSTYAGAIVGPGSLTFSGSGQQSLTGSNTYSGGTNISGGGTLTVNSGSSLGDPAGAVTITNASVLQVAAPATIPQPISLSDANGGTIDSDGNSVTVSGVISGVGPLNKVGAGTLTLTATETYGGTTSVGGGTLSVDGALPAASGVSVAAGATLGGNGSVGATTVSGTLAPGDNPGILTTNGSLTFNSGGTYSVLLNGPTAGTGYSQDVVSGPVNITGASLAISVGGGFAPAAGAPFDILVNNSGSPVTGTFAGLPEGAAVTVGGQSFSISYAGGSTGHDIVLTSAVTGPPPTVANVQVNDGSIQRSEVRSITITFSGLVNFAGGNANAAAAFQLNHIQTGNDVALTAAVSTDAQNRTAVTLTFSGSETDTVSALNFASPSLADGRYTLTIFGNVVIGTNGVALDGAGTGTPGSNYVSPADTYQGSGLRLYRLFGDANGDGVDDATDVGQLKSTFNRNNTDPLYLAFLDADNSGSVDAQDIGQFKSRFNTNVFG